MIVYDRLGGLFQRNLAFCFKPTSDLLDCLVQMRCNLEFDWKEYKKKKKKKKNVLSTLPKFDLFGLLT